MKKSSLIIILFGILVSGRVFAGETTTPPVLNNREKTDTGEVKLNLRYLESYYYDTKDIILSPLRWNSYDWFTATAIISSAILISTEDEKIRDMVQQNRTDFSNSIASFVKPFGDGHYALPVITAFYITGELIGNYKFKRTALLSFESFIISGAFTMAIKYALNRERPSYNFSSSILHGPFHPIFSPSFPSGHSETAFSIATVFATEFSDTIVVPVLAYTIATMTALSRVNDNRHWASDVLIGSAIGFFMAKSVESYHPYKNSPNKLSFAPMVFDNKTFLSVNYSFR